MIGISVGEGVRRFSMSILVSKAARIAGKGERLTKCGRPIGGEIEQIFDTDPEQMLNAIQRFNVKPKTKPKNISKVLELLADPQTMADTVRMGVAIYREQGLKPSDIIKYFMPLIKSIPEENITSYIALLLNETIADLSPADMAKVINEATAKNGVLRREISAKRSPTEKGAFIREITAKLPLPVMTIVLRNTISNLPLAEKGTVLREAITELAMSDKIIILEGVTSYLSPSESYFVKKIATADIPSSDVQSFSNCPDYTRRNMHRLKKYIDMLPLDEKGIAIRREITNHHIASQANIIGYVFAVLPLTDRGFLVKPIVVKDAIAWLSPANRGAVIRLLTDRPSITDEELIMYIRAAAADLDRDGKAILIREATLKHRPDVKGKAIREVVRSLDRGYVLSIVTADLCLDDKAIAIKAAIDKLSCIMDKRKVISAPELKAIIIRGALANLSSADREVVLQKVTDGLSQEEKAAIDKEMDEENVLDELFQPSN